MATQIHPTPSDSSGTAVVYLSPDQYRKAFNISRATVWRRIADKSLPIRRFGPRTVRIAVAASDLVASTEASIDGNAGATANGVAPPKRSTSKARTR